MLMIYADIHDGGSDCVVIGIPSSHMWRVCLNLSRVKDAEKHSNPDPTFSYYCSLNPNFLSWDVANLTFTNITMRLKLSALVYSFAVIIIAMFYSCHRQLLLTLTIICIDQGIVFNQSGTHWERWGPIKKHFTLSEQS